MSEREHVADAFALVLASLTDDRQGADAVLRNCDAPAVAEVLADVLGEAIRAISRCLVSDGDPLVLLGRMRDALADGGGEP